MAEAFGFNWIAEVIRGVKFVDAIKQISSFSSAAPPPDESRIHNI